MHKLLTLPLILFSLNTLAGSPELDIPEATWEPIFFRSINALVDETEWPPLRGVEISEDTLEVRIWIGFGLSPLKGFRLQQTGEEWSAQYLRPVRKGEMFAPAILEVTPQRDWDEFWKNLTELGLLTLPDASTLPHRSTVRDGVAYVVEIHNGQTYRTYCYSNPQHMEGPEAENIIAIIETIHREFIPDEPFIW